MDPFIYHITTPEAYEQAKQDGAYIHPSLQAEGFIHNSTYDQVPRTLNKHFAGQSSLILLKLDVAKVKERLVYENTSGGTEPFPHIYGPINLDAIVGIVDWNTEGW